MTLTQDQMRRAGIQTVSERRLAAYGGHCCRRGCTTEARYELWVDVAGVTTRTWVCASDRGLLPPLTKAAGA